MPVTSTSVPDLTVRSAQGNYDVTFLKTLDALISAALVKPDTFVLIDQKVAALYPLLRSALENRNVLEIPAAEEEKTLAGVEKVCSFLQSHDASKRSSLVVIGGGIVQDIGAFAAHIYYRGIPFTFVPTTLLSMADSCIGAKCGLNFGAFKNQLGFFQAPKRVLIWPQFLQTLQADDVRSGFGEILKLAITDGEEAYTSFESHVQSSGFTLVGLEDLIARSLRIKQRIIEEDEYEVGLRKTLNYGHTFGHALEGSTHHEVPHGLAVAWGIACANFFAFKAGRLSDEDFTRLHHFVAKYFALRVRSRYSAREIVRLMKRDKKASAGSVQLILPTGIGNLEVVTTAMDAAFERVLSEYLNDFDTFLPAE